MRKRKRKLWREWVRKDRVERRRRGETELERDTASTKINILPIMDIYLLCAEGVKILYMGGIMLYYALHIFYTK